MIKKNTYQYLMLALISCLLQGCMTAPDYAYKSPAPELDTSISMSSPDTMIRCAAIAAGVISSASSVESKMATYIEDQVTVSSFDKESLLMSIDNAITRTKSEAEALDTFKSSDYFQAAIGDLSLAISEYDTALHALKNAVTDDDAIEMEAGYKVLQNAIASLQSSASAFTG